MTFVRFSFLCLFLGALSPRVVIADPSLDEAMAQSKVAGLAETLADVHLPQVSGLGIKREDVAAAFVRGLCTGIGMLAAIYSVPSDEAMPLQSALAIAATGGLVTAGFQLKYESVTLWQTHWVNWSFENGLPKMTASLEHGPTMLLFKEFNLQLFFYSFVNLAFYAMGEGSHHFSQAFAEAGWGLLVDGIGNIVISTQVVKMVTKLHRLLEKGEASEIEVRQKQRRIWALGKVAATTLSAVSLALILVKTKSFGGGFDGLADMASAAIYSLSAAFGGTYLIQVLRQPQLLKRELSSVIKVCKKLIR